MKINRTNQTNFEGTKKMSKEPITFDKQVEDMVSSLLQRAEREVCEYGDFAQVYESMLNPDKSQSATDFVLNIKHPKDSEPDYRVIDAIAYKFPSDYKYSHTLAYGNKAEILKALRSDGFAQQVRETFQRLGSHFDEF